MLFEIYKFYKNAKKHSILYQELTIDEYLNQKKYSNYFKFNHLYPMAASIWSSPINEIKNYPFKEFVNFFSNHGLLNIFNRPKWRTVKGGSNDYVRKILNSPNIKSLKGYKAIIKRTNSGKWKLKFNKLEIDYDHVVLAVHSDQVKETLVETKKLDLEFFSNIKYSKNVVFLHSDSNLMPNNKNVWASWNYIENKSKISVSYWMNLLQKLDTDRDFFVSLNPSFEPNKNKTYKRILYEHPIYNFKTFETQKKINSIQGKKNLWFCGAYLGYGFHEDGIKSGIRVAENLIKILS